MTETMIDPAVSRVGGSLTGPAQRAVPHFFDRPLAEHCALLICQCRSLATSRSRGAHGMHCVTSCLAEHQLNDEAMT